MNILEAIEANKTSRIGLVNEVGVVLSSFAIGALKELEYYSAAQMKAIYEVIPDGVIIVGELPNGEKKVFKNMADAAKVITNVKLIKRYREVGE